ncbi:FAD-binding oxidoreductase [Paraburkholderia sp. J63]|uniref:NAD(P)/FAD-dependent oxidoreductase n=1 Tax=Paraburkholderia sp. J63 TaxID=2805434 RepID=UPI002ABE5E73|nr:FAD-binding oxidoreductase [Paraburkholderia sp. J63]
MEQVSIIGAGIVGMCTALTLQRRGVTVRVIDEREPGTGTSFGNAGLVSIDSCIPISMPGMLRNVPKWLADEKGPLSVRRQYALAAAPWLLRWIRSGASEARVSPLAAALRALHKDSIESYRALLGAEQFAQSINVSGQLHVWETLAKSPGDRLADRLREENGVTVRELTGDAIFELVPGMNRAVKRAQHYEHNGFVANPYQLVKRLFGLFIDNGGEFVRQKVNGVNPLPSRAGYRIITACSDLSARELVVCSGAWSKRLLQGIDVHVPLETERGYHVAFDPSALDLRLPILHKGRGFGITPMIDNLRVAGFVEIAGLDAEPDMSREAALIAQAKRLFPQLDVARKQRFWLGFRPSLPDSLPVLGEVPGMPGLYLGFGHGHTGITGAPQSAEILANFVTHAPQPFDVSPYRIDRFRRA